MSAASPDPIRQSLSTNEILRAEDVSALLQIPVSTIHEWARTGQIPSRKRGRHRLFLRSEIHRWVFDADDPRRSS